jgi:hypothetical protein
VSLNVFVSVFSVNFSFLSRSLFSIDSVDEIRMTTTDNYQGEESDIVLLSLVRLNAEEQAGFVSISNHICVALSRARHGMYVIGNFDMIAKKSELWSKIVSDVNVQQKLGPPLSLSCSVHGTSSGGVVVTNADDFDKCPHGGCTKLCRQKLECGHICNLICHPISHEDMKCLERCDKPTDCGHPCRKSCWENCKPCPTVISRTRKFCGHTIQVSCGSDIEQMGCPAICAVTLPCGHSCPDVCHPCGHDFLRHMCHFPCPRTRSTCGHSCEKACYEVCGLCLVKVDRELKCGHRVNVFCHEDYSTLECTQPCLKELSCGHLCSRQCCDPCDSICLVEVLKTTMRCNHTPRQFQSTPCHEDISQQLCRAVCGAAIDQCGHQCRGECQDCYPPFSTSGNIHHVACKDICTRLLPCNHPCRTGHGCSDATLCQPCERHCEVRCSHQACSRLCGDGCDPCLKKCEYRCLHMRCNALCSEGHILVPVDDTNMVIVEGFENMTVEDLITSVLQVKMHPRFQKFCNKPCQKALLCGHPCRGICGERCPNFCPLCPLGVVTLLPSAPNLSGIAVELNCGHIFDVEGLDQHMSQYGKFGVSFLLSL